jgi:hypothetical protein
LFLMLPLKNTMAKPVDQHHRYAIY